MRHNQCFPCSLVNELQCWHLSLFVDNVYYSSDEKSWFGFLFFFKFCSTAGFVYMVC